jgi:hypothetical protein
MRNKAKELFAIKRVGFFISILREPPSGGTSGGGFFYPGARLGEPGLLNRQQGGWFFFCQVKVRENIFLF